MDRAVPLARRAWSLDRDNPATADTLGWLLFKSGRRAEGLVLLERAARRPQRFRHKTPAGRSPRGLGIDPLPFREGEPRQRKVALSRRRSAIGITVTLACSRRSAGRNCDASPTMTMVASCGERRAAAAAWAWAGVTASTDCW